MEIKRSNRPKLPRNHYNYTANGGGNATVVTNNSSGETIDVELLDFINKLRTMLVIDTDNSTISINGDLFSSGDITAYFNNN